MMWGFSNGYKRKSGACIEKLNFMQIKWKKMEEYNCSGDLLGFFCIFEYSHGKTYEPIKNNLPSR